MKTTVYLCNCGKNISDKLDSGEIRNRVESAGGANFKTIDFMCSEEGKASLENDLRENKPDRVVIAACSPREHENTFMRALSNAGVNPYLMQMVNIREHVAWVTGEKTEATDKASRLIKAAINRVSLHTPLEKREIDICPDIAGRLNTSVLPYRLPRDLDCFALRTVSSITMREKPGTKSKNRRVHRFT